MPRKFVFLATFLVFCTLFFSFSRLGFSAERNDSPQIVVLPFKVNAAQEMSYIKTGLRDMIASRLASRVGAIIINPALGDRAVVGMGGFDTPELIASIGRTLSADYVVSGSFTSFAGSASLDVLLHSVRKEAVPQRFSVSAAREDELIQAVDTLTWDIAEKAFSKKRPAHTSVMAAPQSQLTPSTPYQGAHPDRYLMGRNGGGNSGSGLLRPLGVITSPLGFTKSQNMQFGLVAMAVGDVTGDGSAEFVLASSREVRVYRQIGRKMQQIAKVSTPYSRYKIHAVTVADLNGNGIQEIFVSAADSESPNSFIIEWDGKRFSEIAQNQKWYIRSMEIPGEGMVLAGQKSSINTLLSRGIYRMNLSGSHLIKGEKIAVRGVNLFDFVLADLDADGKNEVVAISQDDKLMVLRPSGKSLWVSGEYYGGTTRFIGGASADDISANLEHGSDSMRIFIPASIVIRDVNNDGLPDVIVNKNATNFSRIMARYRSYPSGEIQALTWNGIGLTELWRTRKIDGYIADYDLGATRLVAQTNKEAQPEDIEMADLHVGLVLGNGGINILKDSRSTVLTFPIEITAEKN